MSALDELKKKDVQLCTDIDLIILWYAKVMGDRFANHAADELAKLRTELTATAEKASYLVVLRKQIDDLREELKEARRVIEYYAKDDPEPAKSWLNENSMSESEYKDHLSEQDRLKREAEEMAGEALKTIRKLKR